MKWMAFVINHHVYRWLLSNELILNNHEPWIDVLWSQFPLTVFFRNENFSFNQGKKKTDEKFWEHLAYGLIQLYYLAVLPDFEMSYFWIISRQVSSFFWRHRRDVPVLWTALGLEPWLPEKTGLELLSPHYSLISSVSEAPEESRRAGRSTGQEFLWAHKELLQ